MTPEGNLYSPGHRSDWPAGLSHLHLPELCSNPKNTRRFNPRSTHTHTHAQKQEESATSDLFNDLHLLLPPLWFVLLGVYKELNDLLLQLIRGI